MKKELSVNTHLAHYRIVSKIGVGGMGEVWLAEDTRLDRNVALKLLPSEFTQDADRVRRFMQEAKAASALNHPNIITVYDIGECEAGRFIVMEMVAGRTLRTVISEPNSLETVLSMAAQMAKALSAAHAAGITHRDIKPDNIMVRDDGYVKVLDFGLARLLPTGSSEDAATLAQQTMAGTVMGTVAYMSPELASGQSVGPPSDIFALGIVLYELATGQHPFRAETLVGYLHAITLRTPTSVTNLKPEFPAALDNLILRMLEKEAGRRPTAGEVAQALQEMERYGAGHELPIKTDNSGAARADEGFWVAVLPFKYRGANAELEALAEGLSEEIVTGLSRFSYLRVIARSSTLRFTSEAMDVRTVGKQLGARYVMEGHLRQVGSMLRVAVQVVDASTGAHLWAETYNRAFNQEDIFTLQDDLVPRIVSTVADWYGVLPHSMSEAVRLKPPGQLSPYQAVLRSFGYFERIAPEEHAAVRAGLEHTVEQVPGNADGWAMLSMMYGEEHRFGFNAEPDPLGRSLQAARNAVDAAHANHFAWLALAQALFFRKEFDAFRDAAERAITLNSMDGSTVQYLSHLIAFSGDWERGCELAERSRQLNPNHPGWYWAVHFLDAFRKGDYHTARSYLLKSLMRGGTAQLFTQALLAALYGQLGEREAADKTLQTVLALKPDFPMTGRSEFEKWYLPELVKQLMEGLSKAGLEVVEAERETIPPLEPEKTSSVVQPVASPAQSIAVLPFANISADSENEYFCDGLAEELLNALAKIDDLKVAARTSAFSFKGKNAEAREIGKTLNVNTVLQGSVRKSGNRVRITLQLVDAADGYHVWSERYDREMQDIFDVQDEITLAVVDALKLKLLGEKKAAVLKRYTDNTEAYELYLKGRFFWSKVSPAGFEKAIEYFNQAVSLEPNFALAYAGLADSYAIFSQVSAVPVHETMPRAKEFAQKALLLDADLAEAHTSLGLVLMDHDYDFVAAETHFKKAIKLNPNNSTAHQLYAQLLAQLGRHEEAGAESRQALKVDPLSVFVNCLYGFGLFESRRYDEAIVQLKKTFELDSTFPLTQAILAYIHQAQGNYSEAAEGFAKFYELVGNSEDAERVRKSFAEAGWSGFVRMMTGNQPPADVTGYLAAALHASLDEKDPAFAQIEKAYENREALLALIKIDPRIDCLRDDPRFGEMLERIGFPSEKSRQAGESLKAQTVVPIPTVDGKQAGETFASPKALRYTVGREEERSELRAAFDQANGGHGSLLCVAGEPGIGKTTLVEDFLTELAAAQQCTIARGLCSERLAGTEAYLPLLEALEGLLQSDQDIAQTMKQIAPTWYVQIVPLSTENDESARLLAEVRAASQERMKRELAKFLQAVAEPQPLVIFFDDLHWADVSTIDLLSFLAGKFDTMPVLIVVTYRPSDMLLSKHPFLQIKPDLQARGVCRELLLEFLSEAEIAEYLSLEFPGHRFPNEFPKLIHEKTEGSPLFMADLVRYLRDRSVIAQTSGAWTLARALPDVERELPESVRGMIERKIAQLGEEDRKLLTAASVQGYEFDSAVVAQVLTLEADEVEERLEKLERVFAFVKLTSETEFPDRTLTLRYRFIHVLYQNALYVSLRMTRKATLSREVAEALERLHGEQQADVASELAALWEAAREYARAADYFLKAAGNATQINAHREAIQLARRGLEALQRLPESSACSPLELGLQLRLGFSLTTVHGWTSQEAEQSFTRAHKLCQQAGNDPRLFAALRGIWARHVVRAEYETARALADQLLQLAEQASDPVPLASAWFGVGLAMYQMGELSAAREHVERALALHDPAQYRAYLAFSAQDLGVQAGYVLAFCLLKLGYPDRALKRVEEVLTRAERLSHPYTLGAALFGVGTVFFWRGEWQASQRQWEKLLALSQENDLGDFRIWAMIGHNVAQAYQELTEATIDQVRLSLKAAQARGLGINMTISLAHLAELSGLAGQIVAGLETTAEAMMQIELTSERHWEAEVWRIKGDLLLQADNPPQTEAEYCYHKAIKVAQDQSAKSLELRAVMSLARLWQRQGKTGEARQVLAGIYTWFTEGFDTKDLKEAKTLLDELGWNRR